MSTKSAIHSSNNLNLCDSLFESLLYQIKASKLNYKIEESPFSAAESTSGFKSERFRSFNFKGRACLLAEKEEQLKELKSRGENLHASAKTT